MRYVVNGLPSALRDFGRRHPPRFLSPDVCRRRANDPVEQGGYGRRRAVVPFSAPFALERMLMSQQNGPS
jgi:hypothetical protein